jgi:uncharacterized membrane protein
MWSAPPPRDAGRDPIGVKGDRMSNLTVVAFDDVATAQEVVETLRRLQAEHNIVVEDVVLAERSENGKIKLHQTTNLTAAGAAGGALWGGLIGLLFFAPVLGMAIGAASGGAAGAFSDVGVDDKMMKQIAEQLEGGKAMLFALTSQGNMDKVLPEISKFHGEVIQTSLSSEGEQTLRDALQATPA